MESIKRRKIVGKRRKSLPLLYELSKKVQKVSFGKKLKALKAKPGVPNKLTLQAKKLGIKLTVKRNGRRVKKTPVVLAKQIKRAMRKKVVGRQRKSLPFLEELRKNKVSFGVNPQVDNIIINNDEHRRSRSRLRRGHGDTGR